MRHEGRDFGDSKGGAVGWLCEFCCDRSEGDLSGVCSFDARILWVESAESRLVRVREKVGGVSGHYLVIAWQKNDWLSNCTTEVNICWQIRCIDGILISPI